MKPMIKGHSVEKVQYGMSMMHTDDEFRLIASTGLDSPSIYLIQDEDYNEMKLPTNCPNCNAPVNSSGICEYCGTNMRYIDKYNERSHKPPVLITGL